MWTKTLSPPLVADEEASLKLLSAQRFIEISVVEPAVTRANVKDIDKMASLVLDMKQALGEGKSRHYSSLDMEFYDQIACFAHNR